MIKNISISKFLVVLGNSISQTRINAYTLSLKKDFRICERERKYLLQKLYDLIDTDGFRILLLLMFQ